MKTFNFTLIPALATSLLALQACSPDTPPAAHAKVCVDKTTQQRMSDDWCDGNGNSAVANGHGGFYYPYWIFLNRPYWSPAIGERIPYNAGSTYAYSHTNYGRAPSSIGEATSGGVAASRTSAGGFVTRGGFGATGESFASAHGFSGHGE